MNKRLLASLLGVMLLAVGLPAMAGTLTGTGAVNPVTPPIAVGDTVNFNIGGASGISDGSYDGATKHYYDYVFSFAVTGPAKATIQVGGTAIDGNFSDFHAVLYDQSPIGSDLASFVGDTHFGFPDNQQYDGIDITGASPGPITGGSTSNGGDNVGLGLASLSTGTYYLRLFGALGSNATLATLGGSFSLSAVSVATTPIPAGLPLFISALGVLGFAARRRKTAVA